MSVFRDSARSEHVAMLTSAALADAGGPRENAGDEADAVDVRPNRWVADDDSGCLLQPQLITRFAPGELDAEDLTAAIRHLLELDDAA